ncbi:MAG: ArsR family transcriptional regulator [Cyanobacteria bacterium P01_D01_bin.123]
MVISIMQNPVLEAILGNRSAMLVLLFLENYGEGHASRICKTFDVALMGIQRQLNRFETNGVLVSRRVGSSRLFSFNERNPTVRNLRKFLAEELEQLDRADTERYFRQRQRPRRACKRLK